MNGQELDRTPTSVVQAPGSAEIEGLEIEKSFDSVRALRGVTLAVGRGEALGLVGENGAGKSTLINIFTGALQPDSGTVLLKVSRPC